MQTRIAISTSTLLLGLVASCGGVNEGTSFPSPAAKPVPGTETGATNAQADDADSRVVDRLATARCEREQACNNVGDGRRFATRDACLGAIRASTAADLNSTSCPRGLDQASVTLCAEAIQAEKCNHPLDTLTRIGDCQSYHMCLK